MQAMAPLTIGGAGPAGAPAAETPTVAAVLAAETPTMVMTSTVVATPGSPDGLPVTGFSLPIAGVLFALLVLLARLLRPRPVDEI